ncbi:hypothetical protein VNI00_004891 [Paramarasmius palmivorus]|uniref:Uncharacterized protein n=1 Tax=Paramarasmius palmivorus TaxID=297713 RepID=A0AAW0DJ24_9AGAR
MPEGEAEYFYEGSAEFTGEKVQSSVLELQSELRSSQVVETATRTKLDHAVEKLKNVELGGVKAKKEYEEKLHLSEGKLEKLRKECEGNEEEYNSSF